MNDLAGTRRLMRLVMRRDRLLVPPIYLVFFIVVVSFVSSFEELYPTARERADYADINRSNGGFTTLYGRLYGSSLGELVAWRAGFLPVVIALVSLLVVIRHTRSEEEAGRRELLGATVVGRQAPLTAAFLASFIANLVLGVLVAVAMSARGLPGGGSLALGLECAGAGILFAAIGAVAAQLTSSARGAWAISAIALGLSVLLRIVGDLSAESNGTVAWMSWLSPIGWVQRLRPYADEQWWVLALIIGATGALLALAFRLSDRRDLGAGLLPQRLGSATAAPSLRSPLALAWRLHRGVLGGWVAGFVVLGVVLGSLAESIKDMLNDNQDLEDIFSRTGGASGLVDAYLATIMSILGVFAAGYAIQSTLRLRYEESAGRLEPILAAPVGRLRWAASHLVFAILGPVAALTAAGLAAGVTHGVNTGDMGHELPRVFGAAVAEIPAVLVLTAFTVALFGLLPRLTGLAWAGLGMCLFFGLIGSAMKLDQWLLDLSPFTHIPHLPGGSVSATPFVALLVIAVAMAAAGLAGFRRRPVAD
ncbi:ABC transporter permease [Streptomyces palmae]|uniref:ABC transporter permease n=1 Tax=Streptomyces palmae TaxID=1701085 RepID=A0A4Z0H976_9ACTN|nr:ABC transporter permease [Streptomyces palmae]TGB06261.1 ABC transporter permease [Streptomyces palmae]